MASAQQDTQAAGMESSGSEEDTQAANTESSGTEPILPGDSCIAAAGSSVLQVSMLVPYTWSKERLTRVLSA